jgi:hypothetical protein
VQLIEPAIQAQSIMTADGLAAFRAAPLCLFLVHEHLNAMLFDEIQVFQHAHMVLGTVALIEGFEPGAGIIIALKTKSDETIPYQIARVFHEHAMFTARQATGAVLPVEPLFLQIILHRQVADA